MAIKQKNKKFLKEFLSINIGVFLTAFSFSFLLDPNGLVCGGVGGLATIITNTIAPNLPSSLFVLILNVILLLLGLIFLGKSFFLKTLYGSLIFPVFIFIGELCYNALMKSHIAAADNTLIIVIFSGVIMGVGLGLTIRNGGSTGGIDIPQYICLKFFHLPLSTTSIIFDGLIVLGGTFVAHDLNYLLYGILHIIISGYIMDNVVFGGFNVRAVHIISSKYQQIKELVINSFDRTVTEVFATGGYSGKETKMLICILSTKEYYNLRAIVAEVDPEAFIFVTKATEVRGEGFTYDKEYN